MSQAGPNPFNDEQLQEWLRSKFPRILEAQLRGKDSAKEKAKNLVAKMSKETKIKYRAYAIAQNPDLLKLEIQKIKEVTRLQTLRVEEGNARVMLIHQQVQERIARERQEELQSKCSADVGKYTRRLLKGQS